MEHPVVYPESFDVTKLTFSHGRHGTMGVMYDDSPLVLETPMMCAPFGINLWPGTGSYRYSIDLSFDGQCPGDTLDRFSEILAQIDVCVQGSCDARDAAFIATVRRDRLKVHVPYDGVRGFDVEGGVFDANECIVPAYDIEHSISPRSTVAGIIACTGVWFSHGSYGVSWKFLQLQIVSTPSKRRAGFAIRRNTLVPL